MAVRVHRDGRGSAWKNRRAPGTQRGVWGEQRPALAHEDQVAVAVHAGVDQDLFRIKELPPGPPARYTTGSGAGGCDTAGTMMTARRMVRPLDLVRFSGTIRKPQRASAGRAGWKGLGRACRWLEPRHWQRRRRARGGASGRDRGADSASRARRSGAAGNRAAGRERDEAGSGEGDGDGERSAYVSHGGTPSR